MATLADSGIDLTPDTKVRIAMKVGRLPITAAEHEWLDSRRRVKHEGVVLHMKDIEHGGAGYAELDLSDKNDAAVFKAFKEWYEEGRDPRIRELGVKLLSRDEVPAPLAWWDTAQWKSLLADVSRGIRIMPDVQQRKAYVLNCVKYEQQREKPRQGLIDGLLEIELEGMGEHDPMAVPKKS